MRCQPDCPVIGLIFVLRFGVLLPDFSELPDDHFGCAFSKRMERVGKSEKGKTRKNNVIVVFTIYALAMATEINFNCTCVCVCFTTVLDLVPALKSK